MRSSKGIALLCAALMAVPAGAFAARERVDVFVPGVVPGVDAQGNLNVLTGLADANVKLVVNTRNGKFSAKANGTGVNLSQKNQRYKNDPVINLTIQLTSPVLVNISRSVHKVKKSGAFRTTAKGQLGAAIV